MKPLSLLDSRAPETRSEAGFHQPPELLHCHCYIMCIVALVQVLTSSLQHNLSAQEWHSTTLPEKLALLVRQYKFRLYCRLYISRFFTSSTILPFSRGSVTPNLSGSSLWMSGSYSGMSPLLFPDKTTSIPRWLYIHTRTHVPEFCKDYLRQVSTTQCCHHL
jgi:hypothetical protein